MATRKKNSTYSRNENIIIECDLTYAVNKIGGRWKILILSKLEEKKMRFSELKKEFDYITERMLTLQLRALEQDGLVKRTVYAEVPPRVEYELTEMALEFGPIFKQLSAWGGKHRNSAKKDVA
ncbi:transcriptional regulator, HxlR family [Chitinophaga ginsengisegetis]|uniref:Transcriptional regulator, HxlR family n=1 Tax=Chitinophaga ginsengisegetis TaxID=393003 RepID=A0A1T5P8K2_9BACT|nr:helix-turn-helix domain-containing protein [Chitinophaga ginsengisegetis]MDR6568144.1 DNA-binding HxlR family transcriptional regulator [Chitinophaga ginsengisegetis]MDR6647301.1 DNA-binding HxlR family transcriptional regulator [Chitinophaga ginsengisegetis]MDR6653650.1 DNA-binding HxlR family transcriptional regulator [Chitinophaga ginsengisegetis]SKD09094.1 transcriptional regulator, HxlR family [Chitinophaga ginsengisegetis]